jgi:hypothetical protein
MDGARAMLLSACSRCAHAVLFLVLLSGCEIKNDHLKVQHKTGIYLKEQAADQSFKAVPVQMTISIYYLRNPGQTHPVENGVVTYYIKAFDERGKLAVCGGYSAAGMLRNYLHAPLTAVGSSVVFENSTTNDRLRLWAGFLKSNQVARTEDVQTTCIVTDVAWKPAYETAVVSVCPGRDRSHLAEC